jgi:hypothetical protein
MSEELTEDELLAQALASMDSTPGADEPPEPGEVLEFGDEPLEPGFLDELEQQPVDESPFAPWRTAKPGVARVGRKPPPESQNRLRALSKLGVVQLTHGSEVLLPRDVPGVVEHQSQTR